MTTGVDLIALIRAVLEPELEAQSKLLSDGVVAQVSGSRCSVQIGGPSSPALPGFVIPPALEVAVGDHVQVYRQGGYQLVLEVLNRNALNVPQLDVAGSTVLDTEDILWEGDTLADVQVVWEDDS